jgi:predicted neuraminidase
LNRLRLDAFQRQVFCANLRSISCILSSLVFLVKSSNAAPIKEFIFTTAPFESCHASTVVQLSKGDLLTAWFGGSGEGKPDVAIWGSRRTSAGWSAPFELIREPAIATYNPVLFQTADSVLWLYYKFGPHPTSWTAGRIASRDNGETWSPAEHLPAGLLGPIRAKPLVLPDGAIVSGSSVESFQSWACWIERSSDNGKTWSKSGPITVTKPNQSEKSNAESTTAKDLFDEDQIEGIIQPSVIQMRGPQLRLYARSTARIGRVCIADSPDFGKTWTQARPIDVPNPNSGIDAVRLADGRVVLVYNNSRTSRTPLNLAVSKDGEHFKMFYRLESEPGEYSYPAMIVGKDGNLHITYTWQRRRIRYVRFPIAEIPQL